MKAILVTAPGDFSYRDVPSPELTAGSVRVKVERAGICGSDLKIFSGENPFARLPLVPGHEFAGTVIELGPGTSLPVGTRVVPMPLTSCGTCECCRKGEVNHCAGLGVIGVHRHGAFAEEVIVPEHLLHRMPENMTWDQGALVEPVAVAVHNMRRGEIRPGQRVLVMGAGTIGLLITALAKLRGAASVTTTDVFPTRLELAREFGAARTINVREEQLAEVAAAEGRYDVVFDVVGTPQTLLDATAAAQAGGRVVMIGLPNERCVPLDVKDIFARELVFTASRMYEAVDFAEAVRLVAAGELPVERLVSLHLPLAELGEGLTQLKKNPQTVIKVLLRP